MKTKFQATVREQKSSFDGRFGRITSKHLGEFIAKKVEVEVALLHNPENPPASATSCSLLQQKLDFCYRKDFCNKVG